MYHYDVLRMVLPKCFAGPKSITIDFSYNVQGGIVQFTPIIIGAVAQEFDWDFGDGSEHSSETSPIHNYGVV